MDERSVVFEKEDSRLPPLDADFLIDECDPRKLAAYAHGLLAHLQDIRFNRGANGYPITKIRAATAWLLEAGAAPAPEVAPLIQELLKVNPKASTLPVRPSNKDAYFAAISFDAAHLP